MDILIMLASFAGIYFFIRTIVLSSQIKDLEKFLTNEIRTSYSSQDEVKDNFLKFVSDSREWAFEYIEEVQKSLKDFIDSVDADIQYYVKFGSTIEGHFKPYDTAMTNLSKEILKLKQLLPENSKND